MGLSKKKTIFILFILIIDRNNGNWLVKYEVKPNNERDMVGGQTAVIAIHMLDLLENIRMLFSFYYCSSIFFSVSL